MAPKPFHPSLLKIVKSRPSPTAQQWRSLSRQKPWHWTPWRYRWASGLRPLLTRQWPLRPLQNRGLGFNTTQLLWQRRPRPPSGPPPELFHRRSGLAAHWLRHPWLAGRRQKRGRSWRDDLRLRTSQHEVRWEGRWPQGPGDPKSETYRKQQKAKRAAQARRRRRLAAGLKVQNPPARRRRRSSYRRWHQRALRLRLLQRRRPRLGRSSQLLTTPVTGPRRRRHRGPPPLNWRLLAHRFGFWVHYLKYPHLRYQRPKQPRALLWPWQQPSRHPEQLPPPQGKPPVIPLISQALDPPEEEPPPTIATASNLGYGGQKRSGWSAASRTRYTPRRFSKSRLTPHRNWKSCWRWHQGGRRFRPILHLRLDLQPPRRWRRSYWVPLHRNRLQVALFQKNRVQVCSRIRPPEQQPPRRLTPIEPTAYISTLVKALESLDLRRQLQRQPRHLQRKGGEREVAVEAFRRPPTFGKVPPSRAVAAKDPRNPAKVGGGHRPRKGPSSPPGSPFRH